MKRWFILMLFAVMGLYMIGLTGHELWFDDSFSVHMSSQPVWDLLSHPVDVHPPGYYLTLKVWSSLYGDELWGLRFLHILVGMMGAVICYKISEVWKVSQFLPYIWLFSGTVYFYSREVRMYIFLMVFSLMVIYHASKFIKTSHYHHIDLMWLWALLSMGFHYLGILSLLSGYALIWGYTKKFPLLRTRWWLVTILYVTYILWYFFVQAFQSLGMWTQPITTSTWFSSLVFLWMVPQNASHLPMWTIYGWFMVWLVGVLICSSWVYVNKNKQMMPFYSLYLLMPVAFMILSLFIDAYHHRYMLMFIGVPYLTLAFLWDYVSLKEPLYVYLLLLLPVVLVGSAMLHTSDPNSELASASMVVTAYGRPGDIVVHESLYSLVPAKYYDRLNFRHVLITEYSRAELFSLGGNVLDDEDYFQDPELLRKELCSHPDSTIFYYRAVFNYLEPSWSVQLNGLEVQVSEGGDQCL